MITKYSLVIGPALSSLFREAFSAAAEREGFAIVLKLAAPDTGVWEYQRQEAIISLHTFSVEEEKVRLVIESKTLDLTPLVSAALRQLVTDLLSTFLEPMQAVQRQQIEDGLSKLISELRQSPQ